MVRNGDKMMLGQHDEAIRDLKVTCVEIKDELKENRRWRLGMFVGIAATLALVVLNIVLTASRVAGAAQ